jgi:hypothetical protein
MHSYCFREALLNFNVYMDDSGSGGGLFDLDGNLAPPTAQPVVNVSAVVIREDYQPTVEAIWAELRKRIADEIGIIDLPPIHVRLMFGENERLSATIRKGFANPYLLTTREQRLNWLTEANKIIFESCSKEKMFVCSNAQIKESYAQGVLSYYQSPLFKREYAFLRSKSFKATQKFHQVICNPHIPALAELLLILNRACKRAGATAINVIYDANPLNKGFDVLTAIRSMHLSIVSGISESNDHATPMLQVADLCSNRNYKRIVNDLRKTPDPVVDRWLSDYPFGTWQRGDEMRGVDHDAQLSAMHYEIARLSVAKTHPDFVENFLVSVAELKYRAAQARRKNSTGISILK